MKREIVFFALLALAIPVLWVTLLGFRGGLLGGHDLLLYFALFRDLTERQPYDPSMFGGIATVPVYGAPPFLTAFGPIVGCNLAILTTQLLHGALGAFAALDLAVLLGEKPIAQQRPLAPMLVVGILVAFAPVLGWRLSYGHLNLVWGLFALTAPLAVIAAFRSGRLSPFVLVVAIVGLLHTFRSHGFQTILYSAVFAGPLLVCVALHRAKWRSALLALAAAALVVVIALSLSMSVFSQMIAYARGPDATRRATDAVSFSYFTASARDFASTLSWSPRVIGSGRSALFDHETHVALGAPLLLLLLFPLRRAKALGCAIAFALIAPILFSTDARPFSTLLAKLPLLGAFRMPARALLPFAILLPIFGMALVFSEEMPKLDRVRRFAPFALVPLLLIPSPLLRDLIAVALVIALIVRRFDGTVIAAALGLASIAAFSERLLPFPSKSQLVAKPRALAAAVRKAVPEIATSLDRVHLELRASPFGPNAASAAGLSAIDGYGYPNRRFVELVSALSAVPFDPQQTIVEFDPRSRAFGVMAQLLDVRAIVVEDDKGLGAFRLGETAGRAWFSARVERLPSFVALAQKLLDAPLVARAAHETLYLLEGDGLASAAPECGDAKVIETTATGSTIRVRYESGLDCPLTVATVYSSLLRAKVEGRPVAILPGYGALVSMMLPRGAHEVVIE